MHPIKILHVAPTFYPATYYGGPIFSTHALCNALARMPGVSLRVVTSDAAGPHARLPIATSPVIYPAGYPVYFSPRIGRGDGSPRMIARLWSMIGWADAVHLTGVYSLPTLPTLAIARLRGKPVLWSPRGALLASQNWGAAPRSRAKIWWEAACAALMPKRTMLHLTSAGEQAASTARMPGAASVVIPNGADIPASLPPREWMPDGVMRLMFIGRLHPVKALDHLFDALRLPLGGAAQLDIYGDGDQAYADELRRLSADIAGQVRFHGHVDGAEKAHAFASADVCILPSHTENFSMSIAEALAHGVPVIVSKGAPWAEVEPRGCGLWVSNAPASLAAAITAMRSYDLASMGARGRAWMIESFGWDALADQTLAAIHRLLAGLPDGTSSRVGAVVP